VLCSAAGTGRALVHGVDVGLPWFVEHGALTAVAATAICAICMYASAGVHPLERTSPWLGILRRRRGGSGSVKVAVGTRCLCSGQSRSVRSGWWWRGYRPACWWPGSVTWPGHGVVFLHGDGENRMDWQWVLSPLSAQHRVFAPDLPGSGGSATPRDCSPEFFERFVCDLLDVLRLDRAVLVGNSLGGLAALRLALTSPARVSALCLVGGAGWAVE